MTAERKTTEEDKEDTQEETSNLDPAPEKSVDAAVAAVISEFGCIAACLRAVMSPLTSTEGMGMLLSGSTCDEKKKNQIGCLIEIVSLITFQVLF